MKVSQRDIILINFPFSDSTGAKVRPALVVSNDSYNSSSFDAVVLAITSKLSTSEYKGFIKNKTLENGNMPVKSAVSPIKLRLFERIKASLEIKFITSFQCLLLH